MAISLMELILESMEGFSAQVDQCRDFDELPAGAVTYLDKVAAFVGIPVSMVCVGRRRDQILAPPCDRA